MPLLALAQVHSLAIMNVSCLHPSVGILEESACKQLSCAAAVSSSAQGVVTQVWSHAALVLIHSIIVIIFAIRILPLCPLLLLLLLLLLSLLVAVAVSLNALLLILPLVQPIGVSTAGLALSFPMAEALVRRPPAAGCRVGAAAWGAPLGGPWGVLLLGRLALGGPGCGDKERKASDKMSINALESALQAF